MKYITWNYNEPGISFSISAGRINIFKTTLNALRYPPYFRFLFDKDNRKFAVVFSCCSFLSDKFGLNLAYRQNEQFYTCFIRFFGI